MHGGYYFSLPEEMQRGEPSEIRETQFRSCNCPGTTLKHQDFVPLLLGPHKAAERGTVEAVETLLARGADLAARDNDDKLPFDYARDNEHLKNTSGYWKLNQARFE